VWGWVGAPLSDHQPQVPHHKHREIPRRWHTPTRTRRRPNLPPAAFNHHAHGASRSRRGRAAPCAGVPTPHPTTHMAGSGGPAQLVAGLQQLPPPGASAQEVLFRRMLLQCCQHAVAAQQQRAGAAAAGTQQLAGGPLASWREDAKFSVVRWRACAVSGGCARVGPTAARALPSATQLNPRAHAPTGARRAAGEAVRAGACQRSSAPRARRAAAVQGPRAGAGQRAAAAAAAGVLPAGRRRRRQRSGQRQQCGSGSGGWARPAGRGRQQAAASRGAGGARQVRVCL
jgi:hypothetical protein